MEGMGVGDLKGTEGMGEQYVKGTGERYVKGTEGTGARRARWERDLANSSKSQYNFLSVQTAKL